MKLEFSKIFKNHNRLFLFSFVFIALFLFSRLFGYIDYYSKGNLYYYSNLSFINGIDITRGYGVLRNVNEHLTRILFNKLYYPGVLVIKYTTILFEELIKVILY